MRVTHAPGRPRNDLRQYDDLAGEWTRRDGEFAALYWLAAARSALIPPPPRPDAVLVDVACGGGLMADHVSGYRHIGVDLVRSALRVAATRGVEVVQGDATALPLPDGCADVVVAGEVLEHVRDTEAVVAEVARVCRPGGTILVDSINATWWARVSMVTIMERLPGGPPPRIHDPDLFVRPGDLRRMFARHGVELTTQGLRAHPLDWLRFVIDRRRSVRMLGNRWSQATVYQGIGRKGGSGSAGRP